jgi:K+-transporting ATPase KdpF subunit
LTLSGGRTDRPFGGYRDRGTGDTIPADECRTFDRGSGLGGRRFVLAARSLRRRVRDAVIVDFAIGGVLALAALVYLAYAMLRPEKF